MELIKKTRCYIVANNGRPAMACVIETSNGVYLLNRRNDWGNVETLNEIKNGLGSAFGFGSVDGRACVLGGSSASDVLSVCAGAVSVAFEGSTEFAAIAASASRGSSSSAAGAATSTASAASAPAVSTSSTSDASQNDNNAVELPAVDASKVLNDSLAVAVGGLAPMVAGAILPAVNAWGAGLVDEVAKSATAAGPSVDVIRVIDGNEIREIPGLAHLELAKCVNLAKAGIHIYLHGPAGTGKSTLAKQVADALGREYYEASKVADEYALQGFVDAHSRAVITELCKAVEFGGVFHLDEADASDPNALTVLNSVLSNGCLVACQGTKKIPAHKDFVCFMSGNTIGRGASADYVGRNPLDLATLDRFFFANVKYDARIDLAKANGDQDLVNFIHEVRRAAEASGVQVLATPRAIENITKMRNILTPRECLDGTILKGIEKDQISVLAAECHGRGVWFDALKELAA